MFSPSSNKTPTSLYCAFLVRIWHEGPDGRIRASAHPVGESDIVRFATLDALFTYLSKRSASLSVSEHKPAADVDGEDADG